MSLPKLFYQAWKLNRNFQKSRADILRLREKKFRRLLKYAYRNSRFYRDYYSSHGIREKDLEDIPAGKIPPLDKQTYIENFDQLTTRQELKRSEIQNFLDRQGGQEEKFLGRYTIVHTSGSTGEPTFFVYDPPAWQTVLAAGFRACKGEIVAARALKESIRVVYIAATEGRFGGVMAARTGIEGFGFRPLLININMPLERWVEEIRSFQPNVLIGYPSGIKILCDLIRQGKLEFNFMRVVSGGESLTPHLREYMEPVLGSEVFDIYGTSESIILGLGREQYGGIYIFDDINYLEPAGKCTYLTPLYNYAQPLVRYRVPDILEKKQRGGYEPLPYTKIKRVTGRSEEIMWFTNRRGEEEFLHPLVLDNLEVEGVAKYQFVQKSSRELELKVELDDGVELESVQEELYRQTRAILSEKCLENLSCAIVPARIPVDPRTGKSKLVVKEI